MWGMIASEAQQHHCIFILHNTDMKMTILLHKGPLSQKFSPQPLVLCKPHYNHFHLIMGVCKWGCIPCTYNALHVVPPYNKGNKISKSGAENGCFKIGQAIMEVLYKFH